MNAKKDIYKDEDHIELLRSVHNNPEASQRDLAKKLNMSLGKLNYLLRRQVWEIFLKRKNS